MGDQTVDRQGSLDEALNHEPVKHSPARSRQRGVLTPQLFTFLALAVAPWPAALAEDPPAATAKAVKSQPQPANPAPPPTPGEVKPPPPSAALLEEIDRQPYRISLHLSLDPSARIDEARRSALLKQWSALVHRFVGPPWIVTIASQPSPLASGHLEALGASSLANLEPSFDKIWLVRISSGGAGGGLVFNGREYDTATRRLGPLQEHRAFVLADAPRALLQFALELFNPTALIKGQEGGRALLQVRGASIAPASALGSVVARGSVFLPLRLVSKVDNSIIIQPIIYTYLQVEEMQGPMARCKIVTSLRDPLTQRVSRPNTLAAIGIKPGTSPMRFRFLMHPDKAPAAGYTLIARTVPDGVPHELGITDRAGSIVLKPGFASSLVSLRLVAANAEPMVEFPLMPGESSGERALVIDPKPFTVGYQVQLDAIRDEVIDLVAQRSRLEKRMEARLQGDDLEGLEQGLKEYASLARRDVYAERLAKLKDEAAQQQAKSKTEVLSKNIQARFNELQALIDRYLEDDAFTTYTEALQQKRAERSEAAKAKPKGTRPTSSSTGAGETAAPAPSPAEGASPPGTPEPAPAQSKDAVKPAAPKPDAPPY